MCYCLFCCASIVCCSTYDLVSELLQFVNFTDIMSTSKDMSKKEAAFALAALMEIPTQYKATQGLRPSEYLRSSFSLVLILTIFLIC
jgi:hypothetical protein